MIFKDEHSVCDANIPSFYAWESGEGSQIQDGLGCLNNQAWDQTGIKLA